MIAIVIPYYNLEFFDKTLESLSNQTDKRFTVYIGNDNSSEEPDEIILKYKSKLSINYFHFTDNLGQSSLSGHWNRCISRIQAEKWIMVLGDDDLLDKNVVKTFYENLNQINTAKSKVVRLATKLINEQNESISEIFTHPRLELGIDFVKRKMEKKTRGSLSEMIFAKDIFDIFKFKHYPLAWHSDDRAWIDFSNKGYIYTINDAVACIRVSSKSISGKIDNKVLKSHATHVFFKEIIGRKEVTNENLFFFIDRFILFLKLENKFTFSDLLYILHLLFKKEKTLYGYKVLKKYIRYKILYTLKMLKRKL